MKPGIRSISVMVVDRDSMPRGLDPAAARRATTSRRYRVSPFDRDGSRESYVALSQSFAREAPKFLSKISLKHTHISRKFRAKSISETVLKLRVKSKFSRNL